MALNFIGQYSRKDRGQTEQRSEAASTPFAKYAILSDDGLLVSRFF